MALSSPSVIVRAFGPLRLVADGAETEIGRRRERNVLATLVAARGRPVSPDRLVVEVWGEQAPPQALASLQVAVSRLRRMVEPGRSPRSPATVLLSTAAGYAIALPEDAVDVWRFDALVERAVTGETAAERRDAALAARALWTAEPFAACDAESVVREAERLGERYATAVEAGARALLDLGEPDAAVAALDGLLARHPYRERLWVTHALALYRTARQTEALASLRRLRERLAEDLGVDPSSEVTALEHAVLNHDPALLEHRTEPGPPAPDRRTPTRDAAADPAAARSPALGEVQDLLAEVVAGGSGGFAVVSGEPGIGKSHLVGQLAGALDARVVVGRCHADFAPALWPWLPVLRDLRDRVPDAVELDVLQPVLAEAPVELEADLGGVLRVFDAVAGLLARAARSTPLVVVLEDLHLADVTSLRLLAHLAATGLPGPVLVLATLRTTDAPSSEALVATMAALARAGSARIRISGLTESAVAELLGAVLGRHDARLDAVVAQVTAGNPFFVQQYARLLQGVSDLADLDLDRLPVPEGVRDVLRQRLGRLPEQARGLLSTAAVAGRAEPELLSALTGAPVDAVLDLLDLALASGILVDEDGGYAFAHALTREVLATELSAARRLRVHDQVSRALEAAHGDVADLLAEVAHHADLAAPLGPEAAARAASALARAARAAQARLAYDEALALWRRAAGHTTRAAAPALEVESLTGAAHALARLARAPEARETVIGAVRVAREAGRWDLVADAVTILNRAGVWSWREPGTKDVAFVETLHEALGHLDDAGRARVLAALQVEHYYAWEQEVATEVGEQSVEIARATGDETLLLEVLLANVVASSGPGKARTRLARVEELRQHPLHGETAVFTEFVHARTLYECARVDEADAAAARCAAAVAALRHTGVEVPLAWWFFARAREQEDAAALRSARERLDRLQRGHPVRGAGIDLLHRLRTADERAPLDPGILQSARRAPAGMRALIAYDVLERGDADAAYSLLGEPSPDGASDYSVLAERCLRVAILVAAGARAELAGALARIEPYSGDVVTFGAVDHLGAVDHFLALGAAALGDRAKAAEHCAAALDLLDRLGNRRWRRRAELVAAELDVPLDASR